MNTRASESSDSISCQGESTPGIGRRRDGSGPRLRTESRRRAAKAPRARTAGRRPHLLDQHILVHLRGKARLVRRQLPVLCGSSAPCEVLRPRLRARRGAAPPHVATQHRQRHTILQRLVFFHQGLEFRVLGPGFELPTGNKALHIGRGAGMGCKECGAGSAAATPPTPPRVEPTRSTAPPTRSAARGTAGTAAGP